MQINIRWKDNYTYFPMSMASFYGKTYTGRGNHIKLTAISVSFQMESVLIRKASAVIYLLPNMLCTSRSPMYTLVGRGFRG